MAGHSKWAKAKHFKEMLGAKRGKLFSQLSRAITIASGSPAARRGRSPHE